MMIRAILAVLTLVLLPSCNSPTDPSDPILAAWNQFPNVAGTYNGTLRWTANGALVANASARLNVVQAGSQLTLTGSVTIFGQIVQLPAVTGNINQTGFFTATSGGGASTGADPTCGVITTTSVTLAFSGNTATYTEAANTQFCGNWAFAGTLTR